MRMLICCAAVLAGCASTPPLPKVVNVPVPVRCVPADAPSPPAVRSDAELAAMADEGLLLQIAAERLELIGYALKIAPVIEACRQ